MIILLVDDSKVILHENERVLHKAGYDVLCAESGESALNLARLQKPDLILLDMLLPNLSGPEVLARLKQDPSTAQIPVIVLSSLSDRNRQKLVEAGAEDYIEKNSVQPVDGVSQLPKTLETIICRIRNRGLPRTEPAVPE